MARKSKRAVSGHLPLTQHEQRTYSKQESYGTSSARLDGSSQYAFGTCALQLTPALDLPVATPAEGYVYERGAILEYLLAKTKELKEQRERYERQESDAARAAVRADDEARDRAVRDFDRAQRSALGKASGEKNNTNSKRRKLDDPKESTALVLVDPDDKKVASGPITTTAPTTQNPLKRTSYWLAEFQPELAGERRVEEPPKRPPSPNTAEPLRRSDLVPLRIHRTTDKHAHPLCALSEKRISTQPAVALVTKRKDGDYAPAEIVLKEAFEKCVKGDSKTSKKYCPITGRKIVKILPLRQGGSSFASLDSSRVTASTYRPSMT